MNHTPSPWGVYPDGELQRADGTICLTGNGNEIRPAGGQKLGNEAADLALIASAPDLLIALQKIARMDYGNPYAKACGDIARDAIANIEQVAV